MNKKQQPLISADIRTLYDREVESITKAVSYKHLRDQIDILPEVKKLVKSWVAKLIPDQYDQVLSFTGWPREEEIGDRVSEVNPFGKITDDQKKRYAVCLMMEKSIMPRTDEMILDKKKIKYYRLHDPIRTHYLTTAEVDPDCEEAKDEEILSTYDQEYAHDCRYKYEQMMAALEIEVAIQVVGFNSDGEVVEVE